MRKYLRGKGGGDRTGLVITREAAKEVPVLEVEVENHVIESLSGRLDGKQGWRRVGPSSLWEPRPSRCHEQRGFASLMSRRATL